MWRQKRGNCDGSGKSRDFCKGNGVEAAAAVALAAAVIGGPPQGSQQKKNVEIFPADMVQRKRCQWWCKPCIRVSGCGSIVRGIAGSGGGSGGHGCSCSRVIVVGCFGVEAVAWKQLPRALETVGALHF